MALPPSHTSYSDPSYHDFEPEGISAIVLIDRGSRNNYYHQDLSNMLFLPIWFYRKMF